MKTFRKIVSALCVVLVSVMVLNAQPVALDWAKQMSGSQLVNSSKFALDASGNTYTIGYYSGTVDFDPGSSTFNMTAGDTDIFICKLNSSGGFVWAISMGGSAGDFGLGIALDGSDNIYCTGYFNGTADFDPSASTYTLTSTGGHDAFIAKYSSSGSLIWARGMAGSGEAKGFRLASESNGTVYLCGKYAGTIDLDPGASSANHTSNGGFDMFIVKLNAAGEYVWARSIGGPSDDAAYALAIGTSGDIFCTGTFSDSVDFNPGTSVYKLKSKDLLDMFVMRLNPAGEFVWARAMKGKSNQFSLEIALDADENVYTTGSFLDTTWFDPNSTTNGVISSQSQDAFICKLSSTGTFVWVRQFTGSANQAGLGIHVDASGNVYGSGGFSGITYFDPGGNTTIIRAKGNWDSYVAKLDTDGNLKWLRQLGGVGQDLGQDVRTGSQGHVYVIGRFSNTAYVDKNHSTSTLTSAGATDTYVMRFTETTCTNHNLSLYFILDARGSETTWEIKNSTNQTVASGGPYFNAEENMTVSHSLCLPDGCYTFTIFDSGSNGMCCKNGQGSYSLNNLSAGTNITSGSNFKSSKSTNFCLQTSTPTCDIVSNISTSSITSTQASTSWTGATYGTSYNVRIREQGGSWSSSNTTATSYNFTGLTACKNYEYEVETVCSFGSSGYSSTQYFSTTGCSSSCGTPTGLFTSNINKKNARLNWTAVSGADVYEVSYWKQGTSSVTTTSTAGNMLNIGGLTTNTTYEWKLRASCSGSLSAYSTTESFVAGVSGGSEAFDVEDDSPLSSRITAGLSISPNPAKTNILITCEDATNLGSIVLLDVTGKILMETHVESNQLEIDVKLLSPGVYFIYSGVTNQFYRVYRM